MGSFIICPLEEKIVRCSECERGNDYEKNFMEHIYFVHAGRYSVLPVKVSVDNVHSGGGDVPSNYMEMISFLRPSGISGGKR